MFVQYFESFLGEYSYIDNAIGLDSINYTWFVPALLLIVIFHCVMLLLTAILRKVVKK